MFIEAKLMDSIINCMPILCVDAVVLYQGKFLVMRRNFWPAEGSYWLPGGRMYKNETIIDATIRKVKDETNLNASYRSFLTVEETVFEKEEGLTKHTVNIVSLVDVETVEYFSFDDQHNDYKWLQKNDPMLNELSPAVYKPIDCAIGLIGD